MYSFNSDIKLVNKYYNEYKNYSLEKLNDMLFTVEMKDIWTDVDGAIYEALTKLIKEKITMKCKPYIIKDVPFAISARGKAGYYQLECDNCHHTFKAEYYIGDPYWVKPNENNLVYKTQETKYMYCPFCGREIDWDNLQKRKEEIYEVIDNEEK